MILFLAAAALAPAAAPSCTAEGAHDPKLLKYICDSEQAWAESVATGDTRAVKRILSEDFVGVDPKGEIYRKPRMVEETAKASNYFNSNKIGDVLVRFYGNMAVAQGSETWTRKNGKQGRWVWTDTWLKRNGSWQIIAAEDLEAPAK